MDLKIEIHSSFTATLEDIWENFEKESLNYCFQNYYWLKHWYNTTSKKNKIEICILLILQKNKLVMILPFYIEKEKGMKLLRWLGDEQADYMNGLFLKNHQIYEKDFLILWELIKKQIPAFDLVYFEKQPEFIDDMHNPFVRYLKANKNNISNSLVLTNSLDLFFKKNLKKKFLADTRRRSKNLSKEGEVEFKVCDINNISEKTKVTREMLSQKINRVNNLKLKNFLNQDAQNFYLGFENSKFSNGQLHISSLNLNKKILSVHWGVVYKNIFYHLMPSISQNEFMKYAPGRLLLFNLIQWSIDNKIYKFDFTIGDEGYKRDWTKENNFLYDYVESNKLKAYPFYLYLKIKNKLKKYLIFKYIYRLLVKIIR